MQEKHETKKRREFLKDGLRVLMLGGFAAVGLSLGRKRRSLPRDGSSCLIDLPCTKLFGASSVPTAQSSRYEAEVP